MKIFLDSAILEEINAADPLIDGVTTNPDLMSKVKGVSSRKAMESHIRSILTTLSPRPVSLEVDAGSAEVMYKQGVALYNRFKNFGNVVIKVPVNPAFEIGGADNKTIRPVASLAGLEATKMLSREGIPVNVTLVETVQQAILAAKAGAAYVSPFVGRLNGRLWEQDGYCLGDIHDSLGHTKTYTYSSYYPAQGRRNSNGVIFHDNGVVSGVDLAGQIMDVWPRYGFETEVIGASIRNLREVLDLSHTGVHIVTLPYSILMEMTNHDLTAKGVKTFIDKMPDTYRELLKR